MTMHTYNEVILEGSPLGEPERSHENHGQLFFRQLLEVQSVLLKTEQIATVSGQLLFVPLPKIVQHTAKQISQTYW